MSDDPDIVMRREKLDDIRRVVQHGSAGRRVIIRT